VSRAVDSAVVVRQSLVGTYRSWHGVGFYLAGASTWTPCRRTA
jgi:hypothetical protein